MTTAKRKLQKLVSNLENQTLIVFLVESRRLAKNVSWVAANPIIKQFIYAQLPRLWRSQKTQPPLENGSFEQIGIHLEKDSESDVSRVIDELQVITVSQYADMQRLRLATKHYINYKTGIL